MPHLARDPRRIGAETIIDEIRSQRDQGSPGSAALAGQPLADFDYLLLMCAYLIIMGEEGVDETLARIVKECLEERRRH